MASKVHGMSRAWRWSAVLLVALPALMALGVGCAPRGPEEQVAQRLKLQERRLSGRNFAAAYQVCSPAWREAHTLGEFIERFTFDPPDSPVSMVAVTVRAEVDVAYASYTWLVGNLDSRPVKDERWVQAGGAWYREEC